MNKRNKSQFLADSVKRLEENQFPTRELQSLSLSRRDSILQAEARLSQAGVSNEVKNRLLSSSARDDFPSYTANIENYIGTVSIPIGMAGPLSIKGSHAHGNYYIPLATTEAALVASYNRGLKVIKESGGCTSMVLNNAVQRAPCFAFNSLIESAKFCVWIDQNFHTLKEISENTTRFGKLQYIDYQTESNFVVLIFHFTTGQASGQNMVTLATDAAYQYILDHCPIKPQFHTLEANASGEKKSTLKSLMGVRGYKITAEIIVPRDVFERELQVSIESYLAYAKLTHQTDVLYSNLNPHGHFANGIAGMYIACGQDIACVAETATGIYKTRSIDSDHLYLSVTMPNLIVGTVGGGTQLPHQKACLELLGLKSKENTAAELAEIIAGVCLAGEISLSAAISSGNFARAHKVLARTRRKTKPEL